MAETLERHTRELEQASAKLQQACTETAERNRAYLEMLGFVTHELKSPLASIVFAIGSLREGLLGPLNDAQLAALRSAAVSADSLHETITNYLNLSRIEEGALRLAPRSVAFESEIVAPLVERFAKLAGERQMQIESRVPEALVGYCDPALITSVLQNLLSNAVKYARRGGRIRVRGERDGDGRQVRLSVWNEGRGIADEDRERLFRRFSRLEPGDTRPGTGLGLFVSRRIVESHGGRLWVESQPGEWVEFVLSLPDVET
jgi:signal transduction histidine kinase